MLENAKQNSEFMRKKGGLGLARLLLMEEEKKMVDFTTIVLPSKENARLAQEKEDWGEDWVSFRDYAFTAAEEVSSRGLIPLFLLAD